MVTDLHWEELSPKEGQTVRINWAKWYADKIGTRQTIGVFVKYSGGRCVIDIGDRHVWLTDTTGLEVLQ